MIRLFCGYDVREAIGFHVFVASVLRHTTGPVSITPLGQSGVGAGSNAFTFSRFLVPLMCRFKGWAVFADACDMLLQADLGELLALADDTKAVQVVKHCYRTRHPVKYVGTSMQCRNLDYERKNWASLMLINCEHPAWAGIGPVIVPRMPPLELLQLRFLKDAEIGALPGEWNRLVDEGQPRQGAKLLHWTAGIPAFDHYADAPAASLWHEERIRMETAA